MAKGLFIVGFTVEEVLAIQAKAKKLLLEGKTVKRGVHYGERLFYFQHFACISVK